MAEVRVNLHDSTAKNTSTALYLGWAAIALFYFYQYILRVAPGVLVTDLRQTFHLTGEQFSTLGAYYLYAYSLCQIPLGMLVDYIGVRKTVITSVAICVLGALLLSSATTLFELELSRVLVGLGSACAFMGALKMVVDYLPAGHRGFLMGATLTLGTVGALVAGKPLAMLTDHVGWRESISCVTYLGIAILLIAIWLLPRPRKTTLSSLSTKLFPTLAKSLWSVVTSREIMLYAVLAIGVYTPLSVLADLWGVSFLMQKYTLTRTEAAQFSMMMYVGLGLGCLIIPWLSEKYHFLNRSIQICIFGTVFVFALLLYGPLLSHVELAITLILLGCFCGVEMLCFTGASQFANAQNVGTTLGVVNTLNMLGGGLLQQAIGWMLDYNWAGAVDGVGLRYYSVHDYTISLSVLLVVVIACSVLSLRLPQTK